MDKQIQKEKLVTLLEEDYRTNGPGVDRVLAMNSQHIVDVPTRIFDVRDYFYKRGFRIDNLRRTGKGTKVALYKLIPLDSPLTASKPLKSDPERAEKAKRTIVINDYGVMRKIEV